MLSNISESIYSSSHSNMQLDGHGPLKELELFNVFIRPAVPDPNLNP
jgi:hypothetical protein